MAAESEHLVVLELPRVDSDKLQMLTDAEKDVALGIVAGESNQDIAERRGVSVRTVANQISVIFDKLDVRGRSALVVALTSRR